VGITPFRALDLAGFMVLSEVGTGSPHHGVRKLRMTQANCALRLQASIKAEAERLAKAEGTTLNQFINVAVEKIAALRR
jgi:hypothetical protein